MGIGLTEWVVIAAVVALLFGSGKISALLGDLGKGVREFKRGLADSENSPPATEIKPSVSVLTEAAPINDHRVTPSDQLATDPAIRQAI